jgi:multicomponent Na+:H+ antiporter subunit B
MAERHAEEHARQEPHAEEGWHRPWLVILIVAGAATVMLLGVTGLPGADISLPHIARHAMLIALPRWDTTEAVSEVVYGSRGLDTFGETFILLAAVVSVNTLARSREARREYVGEEAAGAEEQAQADPGGGEDLAESEARGAEEEEQDEDDNGGERQPDDADNDPLGKPGPERAAGMTVMVRTGARAVALIVGVAGVFLGSWSWTPGGGFPAGVVVAGVAVLLYAALGHRAVAKVVRPEVQEPIEMAFAAVIIAIGIGGLVEKGSFFDNWIPLGQPQTLFGGGTVEVFSAAELIEVATGLIIAIFALLAMQHDWAPDEGEHGDEDGNSK